MAQKLVRCIEGHVYDSRTHKKCPVCGSEHAHSEKTDKPEKNGSQSSTDTGGSKPNTQSVYIAGGIGVLLLLLVGGWAMGLFDPSGPDDDGTGKEGSYSQTRSCD